MNEDRPSAREEQGYVEQGGLGLGRTPPKQTYCLSPSCSAGGKGVVVQGVCTACGKGVLPYQPAKKRKAKRRW